jgi:hypothetical protein
MRWHAARQRRLALGAEARKAAARTDSITWLTDPPADRHRAAVDADHEAAKRKERAALRGLYRACAHARGDAIEAVVVDVPMLNLEACA